MSEKKHNWIHEDDMMFLDKKDKRYQEYLEYKKQHGFSPDELWNLDVTISLFILPRLRSFKEKTIGFPNSLGSMEAWHKELDKMIAAFEELSNKDDLDMDELKIEAGLDSFHTYFRDLWW